MCDLPYIYTCTFRPHHANTLGDGSCPEPCRNLKKHGKHRKRKGKQLHKDRDSCPVSPSRSLVLYWIVTARKWFNLEFRLLDQILQGFFFCWVSFQLDQPPDLVPQLMPKQSQMRTSVRWPFHWRPTWPTLSLKSSVSYTWDTRWSWNAQQGTLQCILFWICIDAWLN